MRDGAKLAVNDYWRQAIDAGCDVILRGQTDLATADFCVIRRAKANFGASTHDEAELFRALETGPVIAHEGRSIRRSRKPWPSRRQAWHV
ncbi:MAG: thiamine phosphate synthase [Beijerinckiaceae bacterium]